MKHISYLILTAITFWEYSQALSAFNSLELSRLEWGEEIKNIYVFKHPMTSIISISAKHGYSSDINTASSNATSNLILDSK